MCSDTENPELFQRVILGYGQFGVITEATLVMPRHYASGGGSSNCRVSGMINRNRSITIC